MQVKFYLDHPGKAIKHRRESTLYIFFRTNSFRAKANTSVKLEPRAWDAVRQLVKKNYPGSMELNSWLVELKMIVQNELRTLLLKERTVTSESFKEVVNKYLGRATNGKKDDFIGRLNEYIELRRTSSGHNTVKKIVTARNHIQDFVKVHSMNLTFDRINVEFMELFVNYLINTKKHLNNTVLKQISILKSFMNWANNRGYTANTDFRKFNVGEDDTDIIALSSEELKQLYEFDLSNNPRLAKVRDLFCLEVFTGQRFSDIITLDWEAINFSERTWSLTTKKTRTRIEVPLSKFSIDILQRYSEARKLPKISNQKMNQFLKDLGELVKMNRIITITQYSGSKRIEKKGPLHQFLSSHVARKTFVTLSFEKGMSPETVMAITGHRNYKTMKKYLHVTNQRTSQELSQAWSESIFKNNFSTTNPND